MLSWVISFYVAGPTVAADAPQVVAVWPGTAPDEPGTIGEERVRMSPQLDRTQVEVTELTRLVTNVTKPTLTLYCPAPDQDTGTAVLICPGGGYWDLYWQLEGEEVAAWLNTLGVTGIILLKAKDKDEIAPGLRIPATAPPIFLAHGGDDIISPPEHSVLMYLALKKAGVPAELHIYATAAHDFGVRPSDHPCSTWIQACAAWMRHQGFLTLPAQTP